MVSERTVAPSSVIFRIGDSAEWARAPFSREWVPERHMYETW